MFKDVNKSKLTKIILFFTTFAFVGTGVVAIILYKIFGGISGAVAVNGREIPFVEINFRVNQIKANLEAQGLTENIKRFEKDLLRLAVKQAINDELLYQEAEKENIVATKEEVKRFILDMDIFKEDGKFSKEKYIQFLQNFGISPQFFENLIQKKLSIVHLLNFITLGNYITDEEIKGLTALRNASITGKVLILEPKDISLSESELKEFYEKNKEKFKVKEGKKIVIYRIDVKKLGKDTALEKAKNVYQFLKEGKSIEDNEVEKVFEGVYKTNINLSENLKREIEKLGKDKNLLFLKNGNEIFVGKYLGEGYSYKSFEDVKDKLINQLLTAKKEKVIDNLYKSIEKDYKNRSLEDLAEIYKGEVKEIKDKPLVSFAVDFGLNPNKLNEFLSKGVKLIKGRDKVLVVDIKEITLKTNSNKLIKDMIYSMKQETILNMYLDKLKTDAEIEINPLLKEKLK